jgi:hypothetical protein
VLSDALQLLAWSHFLRKPELHFPENALPSPQRDNGALEVPQIGDDRPRSRHHELLAELSAGMAVAKGGRRHGGHVLHNILRARNRGLAGQKR